MLTSLCENNPVHINAYLLHSELKEEDMQYMQDCLKKYDIMLIPIPIDQKIFHDRFPRDEKWSVEAYYRLLLLDCLSTDEIIVCADACGKYGNDLNEKQRQMFAPMLELGFQYFNSGVMLLNTAKMREKYNFDFIFG